VGRCGDFEYNARRFALLGKVAAHLAWGDVDPIWKADVLHAHDWHAGLAPVYLSQNPVRRVRSVFSVHNLAYQGLFSPDDWATLQLDPWMLRPLHGLEYHGWGSFMKGGLAFSDWLSTVSPRYAYEITTPEFGAGLDGLLLSRRDRLTGILNGIDQAVWNPQTDGLVAANYSAHDLNGKWVDKERVQHELGLAVDPGRMLAVMVSRLTDQKGADLLLGVLPKMREQGIQLALVGSGDPALQDAFRKAIRDNMTRELENAQRAIRRNRMFTALLEKNAEQLVPESLVRMEAEHMAHEVAVVQLVADAAGGDVVDRQVGVGSSLYRAGLGPLVAQAGSQAQSLTDLDLVERCQAVATDAEQGADTAAVSVGDGAVVM